MAAGMVLKLLINLSRGASLKANFRPEVKLRREDGEMILAFGPATVFTNDPGLKKSWTGSRRATVSLLTSQKRG